MFSLRKYSETTPCIRGNEILTSILDKNGIYKLWLNSEHIFLITKGDPNLYSFDIVPQLKWRRSVQTTQNDCILEESPDPVIEVIWDKSDPSLVFVIFETGATNFWEFLRPSHEWIKHKTIQLSNAKRSQIINVEWHGESGNLFWCEKRGLAADAYCVCYRSVNIRNKSEKVNIEIGSTQAILHNCPLVSIYVFKNGICIQPCQIYMERILIFWTIGCLNVKAVVVKNGKVDEAVSCHSDFRDITMSLVGSWTESDDDENKIWVEITGHNSSGDLLLLSRTGTLFKLSLKSNIIKLIPMCKLKLPSSIHQNSDQHCIFSNGVTFGIIDCNSLVYIYDIISGKLLQTLQEFSPWRVQVLASNCKHAVFWTSNNIWTLHGMAANELVKMVTVKEHSNGEIVNDEIAQGQTFREEIKSNIEVNEVLPKATAKKQAFSREHSFDARDVLPENGTELPVPGGLDLLDIVNWLYAFGLKHSAMVLLLEHVISRTKRGEEVPESTLHHLKHLGKEVLQNPGILLTLVQKDSRLKEECRSELKSFLDEIDQAVVPSEFMTPLNLRVLPFLRVLHERWNEELIIPTLDLNTLPKVLKDSVADVIDVSVKSVVAGTPDAVAMEKVEILSFQESEQAAKALLGKNGETLLLENGDVNDIGAVLRGELNDRRWKRRRSVENAIIIGTVFRLLYKHRPEKLLDVLDMASKCIGEGASKDEATLQDLQDSVRDFMLDYLPSVWSEKECDLDRIKIHAQILLRLGLNRDALAIFLQRQLWQEAVELYEEISRSSTDNLEVSQLYEILLSGLLRGCGTSKSELLTKVFELKPKLIEAQNLFEVCLRNTTDTSKENVFIEQCLTVGEAKKTVLKFLPKT